MPAVLLIRAYRVGQARFLRHCIEELLRQSSGDHLEGLATLEMIETVSDYVDRVVEQVLTTFGQARDDWLRDRSAVLAMRVRELLASRPVDIGATEHALGYRLDQHHVGIVAWVDEPAPAYALERIRRVVVTLGRDLGCPATPLVVPADESNAWAWIVQTDLARTKELDAATTSEPTVSLAVGEPARGIDGFRRSHRQANSARGVALAAGDQRSNITPFVEVAPIAMLSPTSTRHTPGTTRRSVSWPSTRAATRDCARRRGFPADRRQLHRDRRADVPPPQHRAVPGAQSRRGARPTAPGRAARRRTRTARLPLDEGRRAASSTLIRRADRLRGPRTMRPVSIVSSGR